MARDERSKTDMTGNGAFETEDEELERLANEERRLRMANRNVESEGDSKEEDNDVEMLSGAESAAEFDGESDKDSGKDWSRGRSKTRTGARRKIVISCSSCSSSGSSDSVGSRGSFRRLAAGLAHSSPSSRASEETPATTRANLREAVPSSEISAVVVSSPEMPAVPQVSTWKLSPFPSTPAVSAAQQVQSASPSPPALASSQPSVAASKDASSVCQENDRNNGGRVAGVESPQRLFPTPLAVTPQLNLNNCLDLSEDEAPVNNDVSCPADRIEISSHSSPSATSIVQNATSVLATSTETEAEHRSLSNRLEPTSAESNLIAQKDKTATAAEPLQKKRRKQQYPETPRRPPSPVEDLSQPGPSHGRRISIPPLAPVELLPQTSSSSNQIAANGETRQRLDFQFMRDQFAQAHAGWLAEGLDFDDAFSAVLKWLSTVKVENWPKLLTPRTSDYETLKELNFSSVNGIMFPGNRKEYCELDNFKKFVAAQRLSSRVYTLGTSYLHKQVTHMLSRFFTTRRLLRITAAYLFRLLPCVRGRREDIQFLRSIRGEVEQIFDRNRDVWDQVPTLPDNLVKNYFPHAITLAMPIKAATETAPTSSAAEAEGESYTGRSTDRQERQESLDRSLAYTVMKRKRDGTLQKIEDTIANMRRFHGLYKEEKKKAKQLYRQEERERQQIRLFLKRKYEVDGNSAMIIIPPSNLNIDLSLLDAQGPLTADEFKKQMELLFRKVLNRIMSHQGELTSAAAANMPPNAAPNGGSFHHREDDSSPEHVNRQKKNQKKSSSKDKRQDKDDDGDSLSGKK